MASIERYAFQYCQKLVILDSTLDRILLAQRRNETDYNGKYSFIGGKMEITDKSLIAGMRREKSEEIGSKAIIDIISDQSRNILYTKKDGSAMILPHIAGIYRGGEVILNLEEYQNYKWIDLVKLQSFEPKIETVYDMAIWAQRILKNSTPSQFTRL